jgi:hypothetical protein
VSRIKNKVIIPLVQEGQLLAAAGRAKTWASRQSVPPSNEALGSAAAGGICESPMKYASLYFSPVYLVFSVWVALYSVSPVAAWRALSGAFYLVLK